LRVGGSTVLDDFDVVKAAGGPRRITTTEVNREIDGSFDVELQTGEGSDYPPILSGIEIVAVE
jgi:hypothetical protein